MFEFSGDGVLIGARMGRESKLFACDFDLYKVGAKDYMDYLVSKGLLTATQVHTTQSGGIHMLYRSDSEYPNCKPNEGVEIKGEGGYIIVPPSNGYAVQETGISYAQPELIAELLRARKKQAASTIEQLKADILSAKSFHDALAMLAAKRSAQGWDTASVTKELIDTLSASVARSPEHERHSRWKGLMADGGGELSRMASSASVKYSANAKTEQVREAVSNPEIEALVRESVSFFGERSFEAKSQFKEPPTLEEAIQKLLPSEGNDIWPFATDGYFSTTERNIYDQKYVMYPLLAERETVLIAAEPKTGKTAVALKFAMAISRGENIGDALLVTEARPVLYFTLEGARAVELRLAAENAKRVEDGTPKPEKDLLFVVDRPHNFLEESAQLESCAKIIMHDKMCQKVFDTSLGVIVIDTLTKAMPGADQNSVEDTSKLFKMVDLLRSSGVTATIVFIHHLSRQGGVRGSTNIEAEVDVIVSIEKTKTQGVVAMNIRRARSMDESVAYKFKLSSYFLGTTTQGHKLHAPLVELVGAEDVTVVGIKAREAQRWQDLNKALTERLGVGTHSVIALFDIAVLLGLVEPTRARRPKPDGDTIQKPLQKLFDGQHNWAFGDWLIKLNRSPNNVIESIELRQT